MRRKLLILCIIAALVAAMVVPAAVNAFVPISPVYVYNLQPSWTAAGGGGVYSAYYGPNNEDVKGNYLPESPGSTAMFNGRPAGIIYAGITKDPTDSTYWDQGLFGFMPNETIAAFAASAPTYDFDTQYGVNPVWMYIYIGVSGSAPDGNVDNIYEFVPTTNPSGYHTVDTNADNWYQMNYNSGDAEGSAMTLTEIATATGDHGNNTGLSVLRAYLTLGMGDSYHTSGADGVLANGTVAWVDTATVGGVTYDFAVPTLIVTGEDVAPTVSITAPVAFSLDTGVGPNATPMMVAGWNAVASGTAGTVTLVQGSSQKAAYTVTAQSASPYMANATPTNLQNYLLIGQTTAGPWYIANGGSGAVQGTNYSGILTYTGTSTGSLPFAADQYVTPTDALGNYSITIAFTASVVP